MVKAQVLPYAYERRALRVAATGRLQREKIAAHVCFIDEINRGRQVKCYFSGRKWERCSWQRRVDGGNRIRTTQQCSHE